MPRRRGQHQLLFFLFQLLSVACQFLNVEDRLRAESFFERFHPWESLSVALSGCCPLALLDKNPSFFFVSLGPLAVFPTFLLLQFRVFI